MGICLVVLIIIILVMLVCLCVVAFFFLFLFHRRGRSEAGGVRSDAEGTDRLLPGRKRENGGPLPKDRFGECVSRRGQ